MTKRGSIFISYRREDSEGHAGRLYDRLSAHFKSEQVFMDVDNIEPGLDFVEAIENAVGSCDVLLAVIGRQWLTVSDARGRRRLDNPEDFVRLEIVAALERGIRIIPVLVGGAAMPASEDLPPALAKLARRNAVELTAQRWNHDVGRLIKAVEGALAAPAPQAVPSGPQPSRTDAAPAGPPAGAQTRRGAADFPVELVGLSKREAELHTAAHRFARMLVSEIKLYNEQKVREGLAAGDLYNRLRDDIDRSQEMYDKRVSPVVAERYNYFSHELVNTLAGGDARKLGPNYFKKSH